MSFPSLDHMSAHISENFLWKVGGAMLVAIIFLGYQISIRSRQVIEIVGGDQTVVVRVNGSKSWYAGDKKSAENLGVQSFSGEMKNIFAETGTKNVKKLSENVVRVNQGKHRVLIFREEIKSDDLLAIKSQKLSIQSDIWVFITNDIPSGFPTPRRGIASVSKSISNSKLEKFSAENLLPLITIKNTDGFRLQKEPNSDWQFFRR